MYGIILSSRLFYFRKFEVSLLAPRTHSHTRTRARSHASTPTQFLELCITIRDFPSSLTGLCLVYPASYFSYLCLLGIWCQLTGLIFGWFLRSKFVICSMNPS